MYKAVFHGIRILVGVVFIVSAFMKLYPTEPIEIYLFSHLPFNWNTSTVLARLLIAGEFFIGIGLISNILKRKFLFLSFFVTVGFSFYLLYLLIIGNSDNCNCFGEYVEFSPLESLIKNIVLIGLIIVVYIFDKSSFNLKYSNPIAISLFIISIGGAIILSPPDFLVKERYITDYEEGQEYYQLNEFTFSGNTIDFTQGRFIVCFLSVKCPYCKLAANKISVIASKNNNYDKIFYVFGGHPSKQSIEEFWHSSKSHRFPFTIIEPEKFFPLSGDALPAIVFLENGKLVKKHSYRDLFDDDLRDFLFIQ
ncbi:MAG: DoxX family protein [Bacteroidales bacterium]